ncbi:MAG: hypothetical protein ACLR70_06900 [Streptococcus thermophilus]
MRKLSEAEWISRFEQVQGRKPKTLMNYSWLISLALLEVSKHYKYIYYFWGTSGSDRRWSLALTLESLVQ